MKKIVLTMMTMGLLLMSFAQRQVPMSEFYPADMIYEYLTPAQVEQLKSENPAELLRINYTMANTAVIVSKPIDGDLQQMGRLENFLPEGMTYNEDEIIHQGALNPFKWHLPQDMNKWNVYSLRQEGYYVVVVPKTIFNDRVQAFIKSYGY